MRTLRHLVVGLAVTAFTACGDVAAPAQVPLDGAWTGAVAAPAINLELHLEESGRGAGQPGLPAKTITGTGRIWGAGPELSLTVTGTKAGTALELLLELADDYAPIQFVGNLHASGTIATGTLTGSGIVEQPITLERR